jgi:hypothetical protein
MWDQTKDASLILRLPGLWSALKGSFYTDLNLGDALALAPLALELRPERIRSRYIGPSQLVGWTTEGGARVQLPQDDKIQQLVTSLYAPPSEHKEQVAGEGARIEVLNGTDRRQLELIGADQLRWYGFNAVDAGTADECGVKQTQIVVIGDKPKALESLSELLRVKTRNIIHLPDLKQPAESVQPDLLVILGEDYDPCR